MGLYRILDIHQGFSIVQDAINEMIYLWLVRVVLNIGTLRVDTGDLGEICLSFHQREGVQLSVDDRPLISVKLDIKAVWHIELNGRK
jgi:hypothetical protein